jgi:hypothetical protein
MTNRLSFSTAAFSFAAAAGHTRHATEPRCEKKPAIGIASGWLFTMTLSAT